MSYNNFITGNFITLTGPPILDSRTCSPATMILQTGSHARPGHGHMTASTHPSAKHMRQGVRTAH